MLRCCVRNGSNSKKRKIACATELWPSKLIIYQCYYCTVAYYEHLVEMWVSTLICAIHALAHSQRFCGIHTVPKIIWISAWKPSLSGIGADETEYSYVRCIKWDLPYKIKSRVRYSLNKLGIVIPNGIIGIAESKTFRNYSKVFLPT